MSGGVINNDRPKGPPPAFEPRTPMANSMTLREHIAVEAMIALIRSGVKINSPLSFGTVDIAATAWDLSNRMMRLRDALAAEGVTAS